ncbi:MAG TPA: DUF2188 domain-containing protein [Thermoanaerobaculia bacterium]|nr:DUF2188 domain-containing protein [Thermoanaerobaculia bacterium]
MDRRWANKRPFENGAREIFRRQRDAIRAGRAMARKARSEHFIHGRNGRIRARNSYGHDPFPPKG